MGVDREQEIIRGIISAINARGPGDHNRLGPFTHASLSRANTCPRAGVLTFI